MKQMDLKQTNKKSNALSVNAMPLLTQQEFGLFFTLFIQSSESVYCPAVDTSLP